MRVEADGFSDVGRERSGNEDYMVLEPGMGLFAVCDGMGGHAAGEVASETAGTFIRDHVSGNADAIARGEAERVMREAVEGANRAVFELGRSGQGRHGMGTTCISLLVHGNIATMAHVGDSRLYLLRDGNLCQLSEDHNYGNEAVRNGILTREQAFASPYAERVTRAVGVRDTVTVDTMQFEVVAGDTMLLCSDGLYQYDGKGVVLDAALAQDEIRGLPEQLIGGANAAGGSDNVTAVVLRMRSDSPQAHTRKTVVSGDLEMLGHVELFRFLNMRERVTALNAFREVRFRGGDQILNEGDPSDSLFVVVDGKVEVARKGAHLAQLGPGSHFGEMALLSQRPRSATVTALGDVRLLEMKRDDFMDLVSRNNGIGSKFLWQLAQMLATRLDDVYVLLPDQASQTQQLRVLSPFHR